ncbi:TetR/AcrR family transcriptional regulator C-terminal domain-containing protein [Agrobacterium tumefaciens]|uniref:TetR/AcrR family transcriptional regulator C-terminal domain-containing protein n=1 Tax=Agrobacterium tumefaciens TaxID=358 RepID=UPI001574614F|nr:TetR/AcrR family transcriptional regulator C-terminal domain-containing protein [Agrobacterium tumefaciens]WCJ64725.1 TetR/AcrR family transcriptional regulator C-terminal domain-containing protein [Agrobacterium tumefaciens]
MAIGRDRIVDEALLLLNEVGIDKLSTRKLAERLGVQQPALYWHFRNKSELLDAINSEMLLRYHDDRLPKPGQDWIAFTLANARSIRKTLLTVRDGARLTAGTRPSVAEFADVESVLQLYVETGFSAEEAFGIAICITRYVVGYVLEEQGERERDRMDQNSPNTNLMAELAPFPLLAKALESFPTVGTVNTEAVFESGLSYLLAGMKEKLREKQSG